MFILLPECLAWSPGQNLSPERAVLISDYSLQSPRTENAQDLLWIFVSLFPYLFSCVCMCVGMYIRVQGTVEGGGISGAGVTSRGHRGGRRKQSHGCAGHVCLDCFTTDMPHSHMRGGCHLQCWDFMTGHITRKEDFLGP